jgi:predicted ATPase/DNA-binding XRE family transcriptional regulator
VGEREYSARLDATAGQPRISARFADLLRRHRRTAGFSQQFLAERANLSVEAIGALERGTRRAPHRETVVLIGAALDLNEQQRAELEATADASRARGERGLSVPAEPLNNLPASLTSFVGREEEIAAILTLLEQHRLVTITGVGGVGKTRTALEAAARFYRQRRIEVWFIDLAPIRDGAFIASELATALRAILSAQVDSVVAFAAAIKDRRLLLILDNCEHLVGAVVPVVHAILTTCRMVTILTTSRERLSTTGEALFRLPVLKLPERTFDDVDYVRTTFSAVALFADRAEAIEHRFRFAADHVDIVVDICRRLDGIPLAIELAAARMPALGLRALSQRLRERFVLGGGVRDFASRQQTMYSTIDWSHQLLGQSERVLFRRLAAFPGSMSLEAVIGTCNDNLLLAADIPEILSSLVDKSLVASVTRREQMRYALLDAVRTYGLQRLDDAGESDGFLHRHAQWFAEAADRGAALILTMPVPTFIDDLWADFDDVRSALDWSIKSADDDAALLGARIIYGFRAVWFFTGQHSECRSWAQALLPRIDEQSNPLAAARLLYLLRLCSEGGADALAAAERSLVLFEQAGDRTGVAQMNGQLVSEYSRWQRLGDAENAAKRALGLHIELKLQNSIQFCWLLVHRALLYAYSGRFAEARLDVAAAEDLASSIGDHMFVVYPCWTRSAEIELIADNAERAAELAEKILSADIEPPMGGIAAMSGLSLLAKARFLLGQRNAARESAKELLTRARFALPRLSSDAILLLAAVSSTASSSVVAARLLGFGDEWCRRTEQPLSPTDARIRTMLETALAARLPADALERARAAGADLTRNDAAELALALT